MYSRIREDGTGRTAGRVMIVAGEASGDMHGARLVQAMRDIRPELSFCGMGGPEMQKAGVETLFDAARLAVVGVVEVLSHLGDILRARRLLLARMRSQRPDLLILIDYPDFNLRLATQARRLGIPVFYYISPQVWAWRSGRVHTITRLARRVAVILPFEQAFYRRFGYTVDFVGHPLTDTVSATGDRASFLARQGIDAGRKVIVLLPGSRKKEISALLPVFLQAALLLVGQGPGDYAFLLPLAPATAPETLAAIEEQRLAAAREGLDIRLIREDRHQAMAACDAALAASGTVLLELALLNVPTVAAYRVSPFTFRLGRLLVRHLRFFSLVNLIAGRAILPELLQNEAQPGRMAAELKALLEDPEARDAMLTGLAEVRSLLGPPGASQRAAAIALEILDAENKTNAQEEEAEAPDDAPLTLPIDGTLDLHAFQPGEVKSLVPEYLEACRERGILQVRIIHGKGSGALRRTVHALLSRLDTVEGFRLADESAGSWGATLVRLRPKTKESQSPPPAPAPPPASAPKS